MTLLEALILVLIVAFLVSGFAAEHLLFLVVVLLIVGLFFAHRRP